MKIARFFAVILGVCGWVLMLGTIVLCLTNLDAPVRLGEVPQGAAQCADGLMQAIGTGDFSAASGFLYGQPDLGAGREPATPEAKAVWQAYKDSISWQFTGSFTASSRGLKRNVTLTVLDIPSLTGTVAGYASTLMNEAIAAADSMEDLYDENNNFHSTLIDSVMQQALDQALAEGGNTICCEASIEVVYRDGRWWAIPDQTLMNALQGGL